MCLAGFGSSLYKESVRVNTCGCRDAVISEGHLTLAFSDRIESWELQKKPESPSWSMEISTQSQSSGILTFGADDKYKPQMLCYIDSYLLFQM